MIMEPIYSASFQVTGLHTDRFDRLKPSAILYFVQEAAGEHCNLLHVSWQELWEKNLFWAVTRHKVQITRLPQKGEHIRLETWPLPTTRTAFPRSVIAYDGAGSELFRTISLWVLMDPEKRSLVLPRNSGVEIQGTLRGTELSLPGGLVPGTLSDNRLRQVCFTDLDQNGHMNNGRYLDWIWDLLPSGFHKGNQPRKFTLCYHSEAREGDVLDLGWSLSDNGRLQVEAQRDAHRIFSASIEY